ncbi:VIT family-domain-containing protein [Staphylotrichum tortipilum]|uniref:VIT family-domain-containing protein n=1 Tax=Staphylotrichum tortipilum TaxID=2831512 RepID=A0AAN6MK64_9PEZI|nr:VIT family-domain-containing protein [Staphylotrichum longicolle]
MSHSSTDTTPLLSRGLDSPERAPPPSLPTATTHGTTTLRPNKITNRMTSSPCPENPHIEAHMGAYDAVLRDVIIGFSDGLTVPFALTAGLSSLGDSRIVIMGGLAELCSGMVSMGLGAWLAADTERQHWEAELARETTEVETTPAVERDEIFDILAGYGISRGAAEPLVDELAADKAQWVRFMMDFELRLPEPDAGRAWVSAATMGLSYFVGGLIPMVPYFFLETTQKALQVSVVITVVILLVFGFLKNWVAIRTRKAGFWGSVQTLFVGALAAGLSYAIVKALDRGD